MSDSNELVPWSWSFDGKRLAGWQRPAGNPTGIVLYSSESQQYEKLTEFGSQPVWFSDNRRLLFQHQGKLYVVDGQLRKIHKVLSVAPYDFGFGVTLSRDNRLIYSSLVTTEADIWLMTLE